MSTSNHSPNSLLPAVALMSLATALVAGVAGATGATTPVAPRMSAVAAPAPIIAPVTQAELEAVAAHVPGAKAADLRGSPVPGLYELRQGGDVVYVTADGRYGFSGDIFRVADKVNLTEARRRELRQELIGAVPESSMVVFAPANPKYTVTVFTDVDCQYCRALHKQMAEYNRLGVKVRYVFFPRSGPNTESWFKAEQVWCSVDRRTALTDAKLDKPLAAKRCQPNPIAAQYELGRQIGLQGTPGIVTEQGDMLPGYMPPDVLLEQLDVIAQHYAVKPGTAAAAPKAPGAG
jgi:thiol:disulfide interchange protein DsbC